MNNFSFYCPTKIIFGKDMHKNVGKYVREYSDKVLLVYGSSHAEKTGLLRDIRVSLGESGVSFFELGGVVGNPHLNLARKGVRLCQEHEIDFILAVGGGSVLDTAKAIALGVNCDEDFWEKYYVNKKDAENVLRIGTVLTVAGTGSESSDSTVITDTETGCKLGYNNDKVRPVFSVLNPELTMSLPEFFTSAGIVDALTHVMERYFTNTADVNIGDRLCEAVMKSLIQSGKKVIEQPDDYASRAEVMWACKLAHDNSLGVGREQDWASHALGHEISAMFNVSHGAGLAILFPAWMEYVYKHDIKRFAQFACRVFDVDYDFVAPEKTALEGIKQFRNFCSDLRLPGTFNDLGVDIEDYIDELAERCMKNKGGSIGKFVVLYKEDAKKIYAIAK